MTGNRRAATLCILAPLAVGCGQPDPLPPRGQIVFGVTTDAPVVGDATAPPALFDRLRIEVIPVDETEPCVGCAREFEADATTLDTGEATIGISADAGSSDIRVRAQLYRSAGRVLVRSHGLIRRSKRL